MGDINADSVRQAVENADPVLIALSALLREIAAQAVAYLAGTVAITGQDPREMPGEFLLQSVLVESEKVLKSIERDQWIAIYDAYQEVKAVVEADPELRSRLEAANKDQRLDDVGPRDDLLDGQF